jgi:regulatory protein
MQESDKTIKKYLSKAQFICSKSEKCTNDIIEYLKKNELSPDEIQTIIKKLVAEKFIDDFRYSQFYVNDKLKFNRWGRIKIRHALRQKRIHTHIIENAISEIDEENYFEILKSLLYNKNKTINKQDDLKRKQSLIRFATSRGFEYNLILDIISGL